MLYSVFKVLPVAPRAGAASNFSAHAPAAFLSANEHVFKIIVAQTARHKPGTANFCRPFANSCCAKSVDFYVIGYTGQADGIPVKVRQAWKMIEHVLCFGRARLRYHTRPPVERWVTKERHAVVPLAFAKVVV